MCKDGILQPDGVGRGTKYKSVKWKFTLTFTLKVWFALNLRWLSGIYAENTLTWYGLRWIYAENARCAISDFAARFLRLNPPACRGHSQATDNAPSPLSAYCDWILMYCSWLLSIAQPSFLVGIIIPQFSNVIYMDFPAISQIIRRNITLYLISVVKNGARSCKLYAPF